MSDKMDKESVQTALSRIKEIKGDCLFYDIHVHPLEVMFEPFQYEASPSCRGLYSASASEYASPGIGPLKLEKEEFAERRAVGRNMRAKFCLLNARRFYAHTGPKVFGDSMELSGVDKVLLLPILGEEECGYGQLEAMFEMFGDDERFLFGYCISNSIPNDDVAAEVHRVVNEYDVKALKIHPNITGINLTCKEGIDRVEHILNASKECALKVIVHGGASPDCKNSQAISYGAINNLQHIDWSITPETVVIAHGGCYGHSPEDARENVIPVLARLIERHSNLAVDTSEIGFDPLCHLLKRLDLDRVLFGSDSLYEKQWAALVRLWCALEGTMCNPEDALLRITSINPGKFIHEYDGNRLKYQTL